MAIGAAIWYWSEFSGPFLWLVDLQVRLTGGYYWEPLAVALLVGVLLCVAALVADVLDPIARRLGTKDWVAMLFVVSIGVSVFALKHAWYLWNAPETGVTRQYPPVRDLDLDTLGTQTLPPSPVRVIGNADPRRRIELHQEPRGYRVYQPVDGLKRASSEMPVPVFAFCTSRYGGDCIDETLEGMLAPGDTAGRDFYRLRRAGAVTGDRYYLLFPGLPTRTEYTVAGPGDPGEAVAIVFFMALIWFTIVFSWIKVPPTATRAQSAAPADEAAAEPDAALYVAALGFAAVVFVLLSVLGTLRWLLDFLPW